MSRAIPNHGRPRAFVKQFARRKLGVSIKRMEHGREQQLRGRGVAGSRLMGPEDRGPAMDPMGMDWAGRLTAITTAPDGKLSGRTFVRCRLPRRRQAVAVRTFNLWLVSITNRAVLWLHLWRISLSGTNETFGSLASSPNGSGRSFVPSMLAA